MWMEAAKGERAVSYNLGLVSGPLEQEFDNSNTYQWPRRVASLVIYLPANKSQRGKEEGGKREASMHKLRVLILLYILLVLFLC